MKPLKQRPNLIASAVSLALLPLALSTTAAFAEESKAKAAAEKEKDIEIIEVKSFRDSVTSALNTKRNGNSVMEAITADDIGSFPDDNVAESLQRVPGVSITRNLGGEGEAVSIRGFAPGQNLSLVNGHEVVSSSTNYAVALNRGFNYSVLPSTIIKRAEVHKSNQAYLPDGGVGGVVNIVTRKPLEQKNEYLFATSGQLSYNDLSEESSPKLSGLASWKISDTFGVLASIDYSDRYTRRDSNTVFYKVKKNIVTDSGKSIPSALVPTPVTGSFQQELERTTSMVTAQYSPTDSLDMTFNFLRSDIENRNTNLSLNPGNGGGMFKHHKAGQIIDATYNDELNVVTHIEYAAPLGGPLAAQTAARHRVADLENESYTFDVKWTGENLTLAGSVGHANSIGGFGLDYTAANLLIEGSSTISIENASPSALYPDADLENLSEATVWVVNGGGIAKSTNENTFVQFDGEYYLDDSLFTSIQFGGVYKESSQERKQWSQSSDFHKGTELHDSLRLPASEFAEVKNSPDNFVSPGGGGVTAWQYLDPNDLDLDALGVVTTTEAHAGNSFIVEEESASFYLQGNFEYEFNDVLMRGNLGVRSSTQSATTSNFSKDFATKNPDALNAFEFDQVYSGNDSDYLLPSANLIFDLPNDFVVRTAFSTVISRPAYNQLAQQAIINEDATDENGEKRSTISRGNPDLEAFEADKYDLSVEWYYQEGSSLALGAFYYDVKTFVTNEQVEEDLLGDGNIWLITQPVNVSGGNLKGLEFAFTHQLDMGLGAQLNYTYIESETNQLNPVTEEELPLAGLSKYTYNAVLFYSKDGFDARMTYNYRDGYFEQNQFGLPRFMDDVGRLSAKVKYKFDNGLSVYLQGNNLTDFVDERYLGDPAIPQRISQTGRNYSLGFNYKF